jgi:hypothetical protein
MSTLCKTTAWSCWRALFGAPLAATLLALSACGDGGGVIITPPDDDPPVACTATTCGEVRIGLTAAADDYLNYAVDVVSIRLERSNGDTVQALPTRQRVDFADLSEVTEFATAATIPNGDYVAARVRLDYTDAEVSVEVAGIPAEARVVDENGTALGIVDIELELDPANQVAIASATPALLLLAFDIVATHELNLLTVPATATTDPALVASVLPLDAREFRVRGPLVSVDEAAGSYVVDLRPFNHPTARLGRFTVETTVETTFEVDGVELTGAAGLAAFADLAVGTATVAQGAYDVPNREFTADRVLGGSSVPGANFDAVIGNVLARAGNELIVRGGTVISTDDSVVFARGDIRVLIGANTGVTQEGGSAGPLDTDAISVGQRIHAFGEATSSDVNPTLDATAGRVRLHFMHVLGTVVDTNPGQVDFDLFSIDGRNPFVFDFTGTGGSVLTDADPANYEIDTGDLDLADVEVGDPARAAGFVTPFGAAPPDFTGLRLVNVDGLRALLGIGWGIGGTDAPFLSMGSDGFVIDTGNPDLGARHFLKVGSRVVDITTLASPITIEPETVGQTVFVVARARRVEMYRDFADFAARVNRLLNGGSTMQALTARGSFDEPSTTLTANYVAVAFTAQ